MRLFLARSIIAILLALQFFTPSIVFGQEAVRPRRSQPQVEPAKTSAPTVEQWKAPAQSTVVSLAQSSNHSDSKQEPTIRVALATDVRSATISTTGHLMNATDVATLEAMDVARVRVEPRLLSPLRSVTSSPLASSEPSFRLQIVGLADRSEAEERSRDVREVIGEDPQVVYDTDRKTWRLIVGAGRPRIELDELRARLEDAGFDVAVVQAGAAPSLDGSSSLAKGHTPQSLATTSNLTVPNKVRPVSRFSLPSREVVAFAANAGRLFSSSAPVTFASDDEKAPVRFNDRPYRGRIEVFANTRGALTVVNVLGLEDYVKGVVPNELSAGGFPLLEAHKAQAIAARTYALRNRGQFMSQGYDLLPTTRSQVYRGLVSENALSSRAVDETRGMIATYNGEPINALYTSTCGGRTEDAQKIFNDAVPYLKARECAVEGKAAFAPFTIKSSRDLFDIKDEKDLMFARDAALLATNGFAIPADKVSSSWLSSHVSESEVREWLGVVARLARNTSFKAHDDATRPPAFSTALVAAVYGDGRADTLLNSADADYLLGFHDGELIPAANRADVAMLLRDGALSLFADATLRPKETMTRARALHAIVKVLESRNLLALQKGTSRPAAGGVMMLRSNKGKDLPLVVSREAFLFREFGDNLFQMKSLTMVGGEPVVFHLSAKGEVDYLEVRPAANGAAADRFSSVTNWTAELSLGSVQTRLGRSVRGIGAITDLRVATRGSSRRVIDLEVIGTQGVGHIRRGRIRSALGLKEQLFVIDRIYNENDRVAGFIFIGRGWGHGVGMCQFGAYGLAKQGLTVEQILKTYYTGIDLTKMY